MTELSDQEIEDEIERLVREQERRKLVALRAIQARLEMPLLTSAGSVA